MTIDVHVRCRRAAHPLTPDKVRVEGSTVICLACETAAQYARRRREQNKKKKT